MFVLNLYCRLSGHWGVNVQRYNSRANLPVIHANLFYPHASPVYSDGNLLVEDARVVYLHANLPVTHANVFYPHASPVYSDANLLVEDASAFHPHANLLVTHARHFTHMQTSATHLQAYF
jgi:hypothetical protein